jgi:hypothetical protein
MRSIDRKSIAWGRTMFVVRDRNRKGQLCYASPSPGSGSGRRSIEFRKAANRSISRCPLLANRTRLIDSPGRNTPCREHRQTSPRIRDLPCKSHHRSKQTIHPGRPLPGMWDAPGNRNIADHAGRAERNMRFHSRRSSGKSHPKGEIWLLGLVGFRGRTTPTSSIHQAIRPTVAGLANRQVPW